MCVEIHTLCTFIQRHPKMIAYRMLSTYFWQKKLANSMTENGLVILRRKIQSQPSSIHNAKPGVSEFSHLTQTHTGQITRHAQPYRQSTGRNQAFVGGAALEFCTVQLFGDGLQVHLTNTDLFVHYNVATSTFNLLYLRRFFWRHRWQKSIMETRVCAYQAHLQQAWTSTPPVERTGTCTLDRRGGGEREHCQKKQAFCVFHNNKGGGCNMDPSKNTGQTNICEIIQIISSCPENCF